MKNNNKSTNSFLNNTPARGTLSAVFMAFANAINALSDAQWTLIPEDNNSSNTDYTAATMITITTELLRGSCNGQNINIATLYNGGPITRADAAAFFNNLATSTPNNPFSTSLLNSSFTPDTSNGSNIWQNIAYIHNTEFQPYSSFLGEILYLQVMCDQMGSSNATSGSLQYLLTAIATTPLTEEFDYSDTQYDAICIMFSICSALDPSGTYDANWYTNGGYKIVYSLVETIGSLVTGTLQGECPDFNRTLQIYITVMGSLYGASAVRINIERAFKESTTQTDTLFDSDHIGLFQRDALSIFNGETPKGETAAACAALALDWTNIANVMKS